MWLLDRLAEERIREARERGDFDDLPGEGEPLRLDETELLVPEELRVACRILKNAGYLPEGARVRRELADAEALLRDADSEQQRRGAARRLRLLLNRLGSDQALNLRSQQAYYDRLVERIGVGGRAAGEGKG